MCKLFCSAMWKKVWDREFIFVKQCDLVQEIYKSNSCCSSFKKTIKFGDVKPRKTIVLGFLQMCKKPKYTIIKKIKKR